MDDNTDPMEITVGAVLTFSDDGDHCKALQCTGENKKRNIARGTTDPWVETITGGTFIASKFSKHKQMVPHAFV